MRLRKKPGFQGELGSDGRSPIIFGQSKAPKKGEGTISMDQAGFECKHLLQNSFPLNRPESAWILNGAHTALVPYAYLQCFRTVGKRFEDSRIG